MPFGEIFIEENNTQQDRFTYLYTAKELDEMTGLYYYGARYYDPNNKLTMFFTNAEIHIYMPEKNITEALKTTWLSKLNMINPKIKFEIKALEDFIQ